MNTLHLRRRPGEAVVIGEGPHQVTMILGQESNGETTLIFKAPKSIRINRLEVSRREKYRQG
jgi:sRNA-binding carbon storage regulator CsrA